MPTNNHLHRTVVIGTSCSGKSTLARTLAEIMTLPHIELDTINWQRGNWQSLPLEQFRAETTAALKLERWVADGNYSRVRDLVWGRATMLIWLNYPFHVVWWRAWRRTLKRVITQEELFGGNRESFRQTFMSRDSILWWVLKTYRRRQREYPVLFQQPEYRHLPVKELRHPQETEAFVTTLAEIYNES